MTGDKAQDESNMANMPHAASVRTLAGVLGSACKWNGRPRNMTETPPLPCSGAASPRTRKQSGTGQWGLPTPSCPAPNFLLDGYPRLHRARLDAGRVLVFCSRSGALGNYFRQLPMAFVVSVLTEQALVLSCDRPMFDRGRPINITRHMRTYFRGPHFDWSAPVSIGPGALEIDVDAPMMGPMCEDQTREGCGNGTIGPISGAARLYASGSRTALRLLLKPEHRRRFVDLMKGTMQIDYQPFLRKLDGCLLRYLLAPTRFLNGLVRALPNAPPLTQDGRLHYSVALHLRLGDYYVSDIDDTWPFKRGWQESSTAEGKPRLMPVDQRGGTFFAAPAYLLACLRLAQEDRRRRLGQTEGGCLQSVVVSDSELGANCARTGLDNPLISPGRPTHLVASRAGADVDKVVLDWWLLARSAGIMTVGPFSSSSSFYETARQYRDATSPDGDQYLFSGKMAGGFQQHCSRSRSDDQRGAGIALLASWTGTYKGGCYWCERLCTNYKTGWQKNGKVLDNGLFPWRALVSAGDRAFEQKPCGLYA